MTLAYSANPKYMNEFSGISSGKAETPDLTTPASRPLSGYKHKELVLFKWSSQSPDLK